MIDLSRPWPLRLSRSNWWLYALAALAIIAAIAAFDGIASPWARAWPASVVAFFASITDYGLSDWILIPSGSLCLLAGLIFVIIPGRLRKLAAMQFAQIFGFIFVGVGLPGLLANILKRVIGRGRPGVFDQAGLFGFQNFFNDWTYQSFPSGHTTTAFAFAMIVGFLAPRWFPAGLVYGVAIALSRVAIGAHYPSDVVAGAILGVLGAYFVRYVFARRNWMFEFRNGLIHVRDLTALRRIGRLRRTRQL